MVCSDISNLGIIYVTKQTRDQRRPERSPALKITAEMKKAGVKELLRWQDSDDYDFGRLAESVYLAMSRLAHQDDQFL